MEKIITYYLIRERLLGKKEEEGQTVGCFLFRNGKWEPDDRNTVMPLLMASSVIDTILSIVTSSS